jgi:septal ring factor EnvC (AmiA/AmiB activator)
VFISLFETFANHSRTNKNEKIASKAEEKTDTKSACVLTAISPILHPVRGRNTMKASRIQAAVSEAQHELAKITPQIESLTERRKSLESLVASGLTLLKKSTRPEAPQSEVLSTSEVQRNHLAFSARREVWQNVAEALKHAGRPMPPKQIVETMERLGTPVSGNFPRDHVRSTMSRRRDVFERMGQGSWGLKAWSPDAKQAKQARFQ